MRDSLVFRVFPYLSHIQTNPPADVIWLHVFLLYLIIGGGEYYEWKTHRISDQNSQKGLHKPS